MFTASSSDCFIIISFLTLLIYNRFMLQFLKWFFGLFSPYVNGFERRVDRFFRGIKSDSSGVEVREGLLKLMQENLIVTNVWLEKKYKGYKYLTKKVRRQMYADTEKIKAAFLAEEGVSAEQIRAMVVDAGAVFPNGDEEKMVYLGKIMSFLRPEKYYFYIKTASFGKLLRDPESEKLEGDCNQIVTLYIYLYSFKFPIEDLRIKLLPGHVCLHFREVDIEATNATFMRYEEREVLPVTEIIATNLLDLADFREEVSAISPREFVKSAQLAYAISSLRSLVEQNLKVAYHNLALASLNGGNFESARFFAEKAGEAELLRAIDGKEYNGLAAKVSGVKTLAEAKKFKSTYQRMLSLAGKLGEGKLVETLRETLRKI